jgi:hypothetical protein
MYEFRAGESVAVDACEDYKTDIAIRVTTPSGAIGYVSEGDFILERRSATAHLLQGGLKGITLSCRGMFMKRSQVSRSAGPGNSVSGRGDR